MISIEVAIGAGQAVKVRCHAPVGLLESATPVLFQPDEMQCWPESLTVNDKLLNLQRAILKRTLVTVVNTSKQDVTLSPNTLLSRIELVSSVTPVEVALGKVNPALSGEVVEGKCETEGVDPTVLEPSFMRKCDNINVIDELEMKLHMKDETPACKHSQVLEA